MIKLGFGIDNNVAGHKDIAGVIKKVVRIIHVDFVSGQDFLLTKDLYFAFLGSRQWPLNSLMPK